MQGIGVEHPYLSLLGFTAVFSIYIAICLKFGVMPTRGFRLVRRADNPEAFNAGVMVLCVLFYGIVAIALFGVWAEANIAALALKG